MPEPHRPALTAAALTAAALTPAGFKHPRVQEFLAVKRRPASRGLAGPVTLEGSWLIGQALAREVRLQAVFVCPALLRRAAGLAVTEKALGTGAEGYEVSERVLSRLADRDALDGIAALAQDGHEPS